MTDTTRTILKGAAAGLVGAWVKSLAEPPLQKLGERFFPPTPRQRLLKGADSLHHPENMPPAVLADEAYEEATDKVLPESTNQKAVQVIHYTMGAILGIAYVSLVNRKPKLAIGAGIPAGAIMWAATHGSTVPALHLQDPVTEMPKAWWVWEAGSHLVFGAALEQSRRLLNKLF